MAAELLYNLSSHHLRGGWSIDDMKIIQISPRNISIQHRAFSIIEVLVALAIAGVLFTSLYAGISAGFVVIETARENLRATQIMVEKLETIRLYTWEQITLS